MASGSQSMTTYYAKRIVGDASAAQANSALLQTGANVVADTWILARTNRNNSYGIKYVYDTTTTTIHNDENDEDITTNNGQDKIEIYGGSATASAWVQLNTGDTYISGRMEIGGTNDSYKLYVNGSARIEDLLTLYREGSTTDNKGTGIRFENKDTTTNQVQTAGKTYILAYNTHSANDDGMNMVIRPGGNLFIGGGESAEHLYSLNTTSITENLYATADSTIYLEAGAQTIANRIGIAIDDDGTIIPVKAEAENNNAQDIGTDTTRWKTGYFSTSLLVGAANSVTAYNSDATGSFIGTGTISSCLTAAGGGYYLFANGKQYGRMYISTIGTANSGDGYATRGDQGYTTLQLGNSTSRPAAGTEGGADNSRGRILLYHTDDTYTTIDSGSWTGHNLAIIGTTSSTANETGSSGLILGNANKKSAETAASYGYIRIYGEEANYHDIYPGAPNGNRSHYLPNATGWIVTGGNGTSTGTGDTDTPVYLKTDGTLEAITSYDGNAATATKLQTARAINGTNFDGSAAITTANWGTARTLTVGATGKSVNGSANISWSMNEIMGSSDSSKFYRGDKSWSNTLVGAFTCNSTLTVNAENSTTEGGQICLKADPNHSAYHAYLDVCNNYFRVHSNGEERISVELASNGVTNICGKLIVNQPDNHRDNGVYGTYKYTKAATIWSMGTAYKIAADGSGLGSLYGAAYAYQDQAYIGSKRLAGGHQFVWCENGVPQVALGNAGVWIKKNGGIKWDPYVESASDSSDVTQIIQVASGVAGGTELRIQQANDATDVINLMSPSYIYLNSKKAFTINDSWLRINEDKGFSSGIYTGSSLIRTDNQLQVGSSGANFYASTSETKITTMLTVVNDSSNNGNDSLVYIQCQTANDWALKIAKGGKNYGIRVDSLDQGDAIWTNGYVRARCVWANQGSNGERQVGVDSSTSGTLYFYANTSGKGIYSGSGYKTGTIVGITSSAVTFYGALSGNASTATSAGKWTTARNFTIKDSSSANAGTATSVDGSGAVTLLLPATIKASITGNCSGSSGSCTGNAATASKVGEAASWLYFNHSNEVNFGGTYNGNATIYFGYRATDSRAKPDTYIFGTGNGTATVKAASFVGPLTGNVTGNCSGSAGSVAWANVGSKPATATRWPAWSEVTSKPSTFSPSAHTDHTSIELRPGSSAGHGGFIDFHFNNSSADYTSRIIEWSSGTLTVYTNLSATKIYNAVWNDFAEYRESDIYEGGRVLVSNGSGKLVLSTERLQPAAHVISDTFGCSVGQSDTAKTPMGVAGRVLAYTYQDRNNYKVGDAVCAAPNGTIDIMTREEIIQYPDRIIGIVDEIPNYEIWHQVSTQYDGNGNYGGHHEAEVEVKNRIWIYVR